MALKRNIAGIYDEEIPFEEVLETTYAIGKARNITKMTAVVKSDYLGMGPFLGISVYAGDNKGELMTEQQWNDRNKLFHPNPTNVVLPDPWTLVDTINALIAQGPNPGHIIDFKWLRWIYETNLRSWNFYYPMGVPTGYSAIAVQRLPSTYPHLILTDDMRLTLDTNQAIPNDNSQELQILTAWAQDIINENDETPWPLKPGQLAEFSAGKYGSPETRNILVQPRGTSLLKKVGEAIGDAVKFVKNGVLKIVGSIPRNAFLGLVGINAFNFAGNMWQKIQEGRWEDMARKWKNLGGNPDKLRGTIEDGKDKNAILGAAIGEPTTAAALLAAAAPIVAAMLTFLDKDGKAKDILAATKNALQAIDPNIDLTAYGFLDKTTGKEIEWQVDPADDENQGGGSDAMPGQGIGTDLMNTLKKNPLLTAAAAGATTYLLMKKKNYTLPLLVGGATYLLLNRE